MCTRQSTLTPFQTYTTKYIRKLVQQQVHTLRKLYVHTMCCICARKAISQLMYKLMICLKLIKKCNNTHIP